MNRIVLIGNGFDLAHGLKTRYEDFINWYWDERVRGFVGNLTNTSEDCLCTFKDLTGAVWNVNAFNGLKVGGVSGINVVKYIIEKKELYKTTFSSFFESICKTIETKGWVDIENEYYKLLKKYTIGGEINEENVRNLNLQLQYLQELLIKYLGIEEQRGFDFEKNVHEQIYCPIKSTDISIAGGQATKEYINSCLKQSEQELIAKIKKYRLNGNSYVEEINYYKQNCNSKNVVFADFPRLFMLPDNILVLNFNYTHTVQLYLDRGISGIIQIHGGVEKPKSVIFGYGDEMDKNYKKLQDLNNNECLRNMKTIKYLESDNYRNVLGFIETAPFQVCIMGHSCGNSDRTLLNTLFEHKNCISVKPYYYIREDGTDNYLELVQNISRNFTDMKLMRDRVVNKTYCEPLLK